MAEEDGVDQELEESEWENRGKRHPLSPQFSAIPLQIVLDIKKFLSRKSIFSLFSSARDACLRSYRVSLME